MRITVNGAPLALEVKDGGSLGEALAGADDLLDKAGSVIVSLKVDGEEVEAEGYARFADMLAASVGSVEIRAEDAAAIRVRAIETLLELLAIAKHAAEDTAAEDTAEPDRAHGDWPGLRAGASDIRDAFAGLFSADELAFVQLFAELLERAGNEPERATRIEVSAQSDRLSSVFGERLAEFLEPAGEMLKAAALFDAQAPELAELPVLLQTGREDQAMKAVLYFIEVFNKVIRVFPELRRGGIDTGSISVEGSAIPDFFGSINDILREFTEAFEHKDVVLIGDLAEYEILPRMTGFFAAMRGGAAVIMNAQLFLAQAPGTSLYTTGGSGSGSSVMIGLGIGLVIILAFVIIKNRGASSGGASSFNKPAFRKAARAAGLAEEEVRALEEYGRALGLSNPDFVFRNPAKLNAFFQDAYRQIDKVSESESDAEDRKAMLFAARERLTHASAQGGAVRSTRQLGRGAPLTFIAPGEESYPSVILAVEPSGLAVEPVADSYGEALRFKRGTKFTCFFYAKGHEGYQFATRVVGWEKIGGKDAMVLSHSEAVSALPARRHARRAMKAPCTFYRVAVKASAAGSAAARGQKKSSAKVENIPYPGTIVDISAGGLGIQCASPLAAGEFVKIAFNPGGSPQSAFAKVIRMNKAKNIGGVMHVQFVKISRQSLNAILSFVYGYAE